MEPIKLAPEEIETIQGLQREAQKILNFQLNGILQLLKRKYKISGDCNISPDGTELVVTKEN